MQPKRSLCAGLAALACLAFAGTASAQTCLEPPNGIVAWWPGDGSGADVRGGVDAEAMNGAGFMPGLVGEAFMLDGVAAGQDDSVVLSRTAVDGLADFTIELWVNTTDDRGAILSAANGNPSGGNELLLIQNRNGLVLWVKQESSGPLPVAVNDGAWHHVALVREVALVRLYIDGVLADVRTFPGGPLNVGPRGFLLGQDQDCLGGCFEADQALDGLVDEVAVYGRALSDSEVMALVDAGAEGKCKPQPTPAPGEGADMARVEALELMVDSLLGRVTDLEDQVDMLQDQVDALEATSHTHGNRDEARQWIRDRFDRWQQKHDDHDDDDHGRDRKEKRRKR